MIRPYLAKFLAYGACILGAALSSFAICILAYLLLWMIYIFIKFDASGPIELLTAHHTYAYTIRIAVVCIFLMISTLLSISNIKELNIEGE